jgi:Asp-tRNA(Asn)/Glu-tRNA(Gln) amidotransferase A subunit family amidase
MVTACVCGAVRLTLMPPLSRHASKERQEGIMVNDILNLDRTAQAELVRNGEVSPLELVDAAIARIEKFNPQLNAVIIPLFDTARALAKSAAIPDGPFRGVPFLLKDIGCSSGGDPLYMGTRLLRNAHFVAPHDTYLATKFKAAGFVILGKTNTPELGLLPATEPETFGPSRNPWDPARSTGGSSGGSAAAVASRMVVVAHANDGGGSIRIPASECGVVGLKPSRGRVSWGPDAAEVWHGLVIEHVVTRSVRDSAAVLDAIAGYMPGDPYSAPPQRGPFLREVGAAPGRLRVGFTKESPQGSRGFLNSPWGVTIAPYNFGSASNTILLGNFGDGHINAFNAATGFFLGSLRDASRHPIAIDGLWSIVFGGAASSDPAQLYFTAGPNGESDGLFAS